MKNPVANISGPVLQIDKSLLGFFNEDNFIDEIIVILDYNGKILASNRKSFKIDFFTDFSNTELNLFRIVEGSFQPLLARRLHQLKEGIPVPPTEYKLALGDEKSAFVQVFAQPVLYNGNDSIICLIRDVSERKEIEKKLLYQVVQTEEKERQRFAQDLHDELGPFLSGLKLYLHELDTESDSKRRKKLIDYLGEMTNDAVEKVRGLSSNLMPQNMIESGLAGSIEKLINKLNETGKIAISLKLTGNENNLADSFIITLYRVVLELINNSLKHAGADQIAIELTFRKRSVRLTYHDNGRGFDLEKMLHQGRGIGLKSIINRIALFNGEYRFTSTPSKGIEFRIHFRFK